MGNQWIDFLLKSDIFFAPKILKVTKGSYQVALPDGRTQIVNYVADVTGFKATVSYEGEAVYPDPGQYGFNSHQTTVSGKY